MQDLILTIGLPASGKTTWLNEFIQRHPEYYNVNRDDIRLMLQGRSRYNKFTKSREKIVTDIAETSAISALMEGKSVIVSDTNLNPTFNQKWKDIAKNHNATYREKLFTDTRLGVCLERDKLREFPVGSNVITGMFNKYRDIYWPEPEINTALPNAYIVDVDGTIAHMHNRRAYEWHKVGDDLPKSDVIRIVNTLAEAGYKIIICSGRDGICEDSTRDWLIINNVSFDEFFIRPAGDNRKDYDIKEEIYNKHIKGRFNVLGVFDDRDQVVHVWRHLGLTTLQVNYGDF